MKVKQLIWVGHIAEWQAETCFEYGWYNIEEYEGVFTAKYGVCDRHSIWSVKCKTLLSAKEACQRHYEDMIMSGLEVENES